MIHNPDGFISGFFISLILLIHLNEGQQETDSSQTIRAMPGDDVVLPCHVDPPQDLSQFTVEWGRPDLKPRFVHVWHNQKEYLADQNKVFKGRTSLFNDKLKDGNFSLKLSDVRHSDNGRYRCYNPKEKTEYFIQLLVGSASSPGASLSGLDVSSSGVMLDCSAAGWYPEPEMFWLDGDGNIMSAGAAEKSTDPDGVYTVSSRVTVEKRNNNNFTCRVQQRDINQSRETHIHVPDDFFINECSCSVSISFNVILVVMFVLGVAFIIWMKKQNKKEKKKLAEKISEEQMKLITAARLEEELEKSNKDQKIIDQQIKSLTEMIEELKEQKKQLNDQNIEADKIIHEDDYKFKAVDDEVTNQTGNMIEKKAQGYLKLKGIITESKEKLVQRKQDHQKVGYTTDKLIKRTNDEINKLEERKQEIENHVKKIQKQLDQ
ncbi:PREDICTED: butyrophilin subfamily 2 member A1-like isoform X1 [Poecilia mexicana]|uniref:butyrophilin subfamily 2 member A1-like isoform X1 n=1 Tax=Poecilia mexicana TaxID=48701 RepID=UPI00072E82C3|nr:PREDICTED: butyrophilin subfamily 2 member A1-like isoform X1 [Poecilia mexicana]XP_014832098.1 PREDICTED: butyrophilin subfamily 2 member A1-like isoform X1 [Poecilia mexicana]